MYKIAAVLIFLLLFTGVYAQKKKSKSKGKENPTWFNLELKGGGGTSLFSNSNISKDKQINSYNFGFNPVFGIGLGCHIIEGLAVQIEKNWNTISQKYTYKNSLPDRTYKFKTGDLGFFVRKTGSGGGFVGLGFKFANVRQTTNSDSLYFFKNKFSFLHLEFGGPVWQNNMFDINLNIRFGYGMNDIVNSKLYQPGAYQVYPSYKPTSPITLQAMICFNWHVGYWATSNCKHTGFLFFTN